MNDDLFKKGDTVYHYRHGKAIITNCYHTLATVQREADNKYIDLMHDELSFTSYDLVNGGFSQVRPTPDIEKGQLIWVRDYPEDYWQLLPFERFDNQFEATLVAGESHWNLYSITNPYDTALLCFQK